MRKPQSAATKQEKQRTKIESKKKTNKQNAQKGKGKPKDQKKTKCQKGTKAEINAASRQSKGSQRGERNKD